MGDWIILKNHQVLCFLNTPRSSYFRFKRFCGLEGIIYLEKTKVLKNGLKMACVIFSVYFVWLSA